jgi:hypothetical protein
MAPWSNLACYLHVYRTRAQAHIHHTCTYVAAWPCRWQSLLAWTCTPVFLLFAWVPMAINVTSTAAARLFPCSSGTVGDAAGGGRGEQACWPVKCECMISGGRREKSASSTCAAEDEERGHRLDVRLVKSSPVRRLHECLLVPVRLPTALQLETMKSCCSFLLPGGSWSLVAANGRGTCTASRPMLLAASGTCEIWWLQLD